VVYVPSGVSFERVRGSGSGWGSTLTNVPICALKRGDGVPPLPLPFKRGLAFGLAPGREDPNWGDLGGFAV